MSRGGVAVISTPLRLKGIIRSASEGNNSEQYQATLSGQHDEARVVNAQKMAIFRAISVKKCQVSLGIYLNR